MTPKPKTKAYRSKKYLDFIRSKPCLVCGRKAEAHHIGIGDGGVGLKSSDMATIPLCRFCHTGTHLIGAKTFFAAYDLKKAIIGYLTEYIRTLGGE